MAPDQKEEDPQGSSWRTVGRAKAQLDVERIRWFVQPWERTRPQIDTIVWKWIGAEICDFIKKSGGVFRARALPEIVDYHGNLQVNLTVNPTVICAKRNGDNGRICLLSGNAKVQRHSKSRIGNSRFRGSFRNLN